MLLSAGYKDSKAWDYGSYTQLWQRYYASMDVWSENHEEIGLFLRYFNEMLSEIKGVEGYKFNPRYFMCDEAGANYKAVGAVYRTEFEGRRVKGCQWHF